jgi:Ca2+:H+ antiporter
LIIPAAFYNSLSGRVEIGALQEDVLHISRITAVLLIISYIVYVYFNMHTHHSIYDTIYEADENADEDRHIDLKKDKLTLTESIIALIIALGLVSLIAFNLVKGIEYVVHQNGVSDTFMGLILVPVSLEF